MADNKTSIADSIGEQKIKIPWKHGGFKIWHNIKSFFSNPNKQIQKEPNILYAVETLVNNGEVDENSIKICKELIKLHRTMENTKARIRLEKWTKRVICIYLLSVFALILACAVNFKIFNYIFNLSDTILVTILSTTTVNVIGLAFILMRGHFPQSEDGEKADQKIEKEI